jgi:hypothetical protein
MTPQDNKRLLNGFLIPASKTNNRSNYRFNRFRILLAGIYSEIGIRIITDPKQDLQFAQARLTSTTAQAPDAGANVQPSM